MKNNLLLRVPITHWDAAYKVAATFIKYYNTPKWDYKKRIFDKEFTVHESKTGTIIVQLKQP